MPTLVLNAYSKAYPLITNRIRASIYLQSDPQALVASIIDTTSGHPARTWSFPGLPRNNYGFSMDEIDGGGAVVNNLALFDVVPGEVDGQLVRDDEQIQVDTTPGFTSLVNSATFDGTSGKPDYIGWEIVPSELTGRGILAEGLDYSWDSTTGLFTLLQTDDVFSAGTYYNIHFNPVLNSAGNSYPSISDFTIRLITTSGAIVPDDFGQKVIIEPSGDLVNCTLPALSTVVQGRPLLLECGADHVCCSKITPNGSDTINFARGALYLMPGESCSLYKFTRSVGVYEWRVYNACGNFLHCGEAVSDDIEQDGVFNKQLLNGGLGNTSKHSRLYNDYILNLPLDQVVDFDDWESDSTLQTYYSFANSSNPSNANKFHFPERREMFERNTSSSNKSGDYQSSNVGEATINFPFPTGDTFTGHPYNPTALGKGLLSNSPYTLNKSVVINSGQETRPANYSINKYVLL